MKVRSGLGFERGGGMRGLLDGEGAGAAAGLTVFVASFLFAIALSPAEVEARGCEAEEASAVEVGVVRCSHRSSFATMAEAEQLRTTATATEQAAPAPAATESAKLRPSSSLSKETPSRAYIRQGDNVLLKLPSGIIKPVKIQPNGCVRLDVAHLSPSSSLN